MKHLMKYLVVIFLAGGVISTAYAENADLEKARKNIMATFKGINPKNIFPSPIEGLYQVVIPPRLFYASLDGRFVLDGDMIDMKTKQNISQSVRNKALIKAVDAIGEDSMIIFGKDTLKHTVTVFTDIDCAYCRKLHSQVKKYNDLGIRIRYMSYPRAGIDSKSYREAEAVWCSKDRKKALTDAKNGMTIKSKACKSPVAKEYALGNMIGIRGTPAIVLEDGTVVPGYVPPQQLSNALDNKK